MKIARLEARPLSVPLSEPFVIASGRVDTTRAALIIARIIDEDTGRVSRGIGEAAALPPVTRVDQSDLLVHVREAQSALVGQGFSGHSSLAALLDDAFPEDPVARAGAEAALVDAWARLEEVPAHVILGSEPIKGAGPFSLHTDITIPIADPAHMAELAQKWRARGFRSFKVKVGKNLDDDARAVELIAKATPDCSLRLDGNEGLAARDAMTLVSIARSLGQHIECFEQPCARDDLEGMAHVTALAGCPVVADESVATVEDVERLAHKKACTGVNLKLAKHGGLMEAGRVGRAARRAGMKIMVGAMVETRLGLTAMAHVARALGHVDFVDLDTAHLLKWDPFAGGYETGDDDDATLTLLDAFGLGVSEAPPSA
jgi:L-alanine-DL-glutamate epimerase-like enolase superfamily enzyme